MGWLRRLAGTAVVLAVTACSMPSAQLPGGTTASGRADGSSGSLPTPPEKSRWLGVDDVMIALPESWRVSQDPCPDPRRSGVSFADERSPRPTCAIRPAGGADMTITRTRGHDRFLTLDRRLRVHGLDVRHTDVRCRPGGPPTCSLTLALPASPVTVSMTYESSRAARVLTSIRDSIRPIPHGLTAVPPIQYGWPVERARGELESAGLIGRTPDVAWPHYAAGTSPAAGTVLEVGDTVDILAGDG